MTAQADALAAGLLAVTEAVRAACADPADAVRLLGQLAAYTPPAATGTAPIGAAVDAVRQATAALARRAALQSLALACADYRPTSADDAIAVRDAVTGLLGAEAVAAADAGDGATFLALQALAAAVTDDLTTRGAQLPRLAAISEPAPMPSLVLAYKLYGDATRADELTAESGARAGLFLPRSFRGLSS